ncbi:hypothetical protein [Brevundimonas poindexterae]|uniref:hypothetical protein n=1 Tax=Brevundimonas poindexterae TaxID=74325 RepID=UPI001CFD892C|nr:hypothetical protein [Brevundimonas poindexterae]
MAKALIKADLLRERQSVLSRLNDQSSSDLGAAVWRSRLATLEAKLNEVEEERSTRASVALLFEGDPVVGTTEIRADFAAKMLDGFQNLVGVMYAQSAGRHVRGLGRAPLLDQSRLYVREMARGSVGFILEEPEGQQQEIVDSALKSVVEDAVVMIETIAGPDRDVDVLEGLSPRVVQSAHKLAKALVSSHATAKIMSDDRTVLLPEDMVRTLFERLDEARIDEQVDRLPGTILGLLPESGKFEFKPVFSDETLLGDTSTDVQFRYIADPQFHDRFVMRPVYATIRSLQVFRAGRPGKRDYILEDVEAREPDGLTELLDLAE